MRKIKFRAWDKWKKVMHTNPFNGVVGGINDIFANSGDWLYMQYTGLNDIKEIEIYEGDIIRYQPTFEYIPCVVEMCDGAVWLLSLPDHQGVNYLTERIIKKYRLHEEGNIYENLEYMEEKGNKSYSPE